MSRSTGPAQRVVATSRSLSRSEIVTLDDRDCVLMNPYREGITSAQVCTAPEASVRSTWALVTTPDSPVPKSIAATVPPPCRARNRSASSSPADGGRQTVLPEIPGPL